MSVLKEILFGAVRDFINGEYKGAATINDVVRLFYQRINGSDKSPLYEIALRDVIENHNTLSDKEKLEFIMEIDKFSMLR